VQRSEVSLPGVIGLFISGNAVFSGHRVSIAMLRPNAFGVAQCPARLGDRGKRLAECDGSRWTEEASVTEQSGRDDEPRTAPILASVSAFFPCYNDSNTISGLVHMAETALRRITDDYEIIVVNDASTDSAARCSGA
jgi:hypothetical protein